MTLASADPSFGDRERLVVVAFFDASGERIDHATSTTYSSFRLPILDPGATPALRTARQRSMRRLARKSSAKPKRNHVNGWTRKQKNSTPMPTILEKAADVRIKELNGRSKGRQEGAARQ